MWWCTHVIAASVWSNASNGSGLWQQSPPALYRDHFQKWNLPTSEASFAPSIRTSVATFGQFSAFTKSLCLRTYFYVPTAPRPPPHTKYLFCNTTINVIQSNLLFFNKEKVYFTFSVDDKWSPKLAFLETVSHSFRFPHMFSPERLVVYIVPVSSVMLWCGFCCIIQDDNDYGDDNAWMMTSRR